MLFLFSPNTSIVQTLRPEDSADALVSLDTVWVSVILESTVSRKRWWLGIITLELSIVPTVVYVCMYRLSVCVFIYFSNYLRCVQSFEDGEYIIRQGEEGTRFFIINEGEVG